MKTKLNLLIISSIITLKLFAQEASTFTDSRDGKTYKTVTIGTQVWMAENLAFKAEKGCMAYKDSLEYVEKYGYLYTGDAAQNVCPEGWTLPSDSLWKILVNFLGDEKTVAPKMRTTSGWYWSNSDKKANKIQNEQGNSSGFTALPAGFWNNESSEFESVFYRTYFWTSTVYDPGWHWFFNIEHSQSEIDFNAIQDTYGYSVRCIKTKN